MHSKTILFYHRYKQVPQEINYFSMPLLGLTMTYVGVTYHKKINLLYRRITNVLLNYNKQRNISNKNTLEYQSQSPKNLKSVLKWGSTANTVTLVTSVKDMIRTIPKNVECEEYCFLYNYMIDKVRNMKGTISCTCYIIDELCFVSVFQIFNEMYVKTKDDSLREFIEKHTDYKYISELDWMTLNITFVLSPVNTSTEKSKMNVYVYSDLSMHKDYIHVYLIFNINILENNKSNSFLINKIKKGATKFILGKMKTRYLLVHSEYYHEVMFGHQEIKELNNRLKEYQNFIFFGNYMQVEHSVV
jgi:hypothetical protein